MSEPALLSAPPSYSLLGHWFRVHRGKDLYRLLILASVVFVLTAALPLAITSQRDWRAPASVNAATTNYAHLKFKDQRSLESFHETVTQTFPLYLISPAKLSPTSVAVFLGLSNFIFQHFPLRALQTLLPPHRSGRDPL